jgi:peptidoglycan/LPS O-acetylase OafA/YrhL
MSPEAGPIKPSGRLPALDGIRGVAILMVIFYHLLRYNNNPIGVISHHLWLGVDLFFVLSGFLITGILYDTRGQEHYFRNFYARRVLRIFPIYYGFLGGLLIFSPIFLKTDVKQFRVYLHYQEWWWLYAANLLQAFKGWICFAVDPFWSLAIEEHFYLIWPLIIAFAPRRFLARICIGVILFSLCLRIVAAFVSGNTFFTQLFTLCRFDGLALGGWIAIRLRERRPVYAIPMVIVGFALLVVSSSSYWFFGQHSFFGRTFLYSINAIAFAGMLALNVNKPWPMMTSRFLRFFGKYSYCLYVVHCLFIDLCRYWFYSHLLRLIVAPVASIATAWLSWHLVESPILRLKRYFPERKSEQKPADLPA